MNKKLPSSKQKIRGAKNLSSPGDLEFRIMLLDYMDTTQKRLEKDRTEQRELRIKNNFKFGWLAGGALVIFMIVNITLPLCFDVTQQAISGLLILESLFIIAIARGCGVTWVEGLLNKDYYLSSKDVTNFFEKFGKTK